MTFEAQYRYRENGELNDHFVEITANSMAEAKRIAKGQEGRNPTMWLYKVHPGGVLVHHKEQRSLKPFSSFLTEAAPYKVNDRVSVKDGEGWSLGFGTVIGFYPAPGPGHIDLVEVAFDDDGTTRLCPLKFVTKVKK